MKKLSLITKVKEAYIRGENVLQLLKGVDEGLNDWESIMISYDFQAGSYTKLVEQNAGYIDRYTSQIAGVLAEFGCFDSIMEVGVGEATLMNPLMQKVDPGNKLQKFGFDISWSRVRYASQNCQRAGNAINLFMANIFEIPLPDNSIDIVYTSHSLEPNGGMEKEALRELYRVARKYLVLLEPDYENAPKEGKERMIQHGYVRNLAEHAAELGYAVPISRPFSEFINPLNPTGLTVIHKPHVALLGSSEYICPVTKSNLERDKNVYFSSESGLMYPIIDGIPCLIESAAILGSHFGDFHRSE